jgi:putative membrane protein
MMVHDHAAANDQLKAIASSKGIELPNSPNVGQTLAIGKLNLLSGDSFDKSYIEGMVKDHREDIIAFEKEVRTGKDSEARQFAAATSVTLKMHLNKLQSIAATLRMATH